MPGRRNYIRERTEHAAIAPEQQRALHDLLTAQLPAYDRALIGQVAILHYLHHLGLRRRNGGPLTWRMLLRWRRDEGLPVLRGRFTPHRHRSPALSTVFALSAWTLSRFSSDDLFRVSVPHGISQRGSSSTTAPGVSGGMKMTRTSQAPSSRPSVRGLGRERSAVVRGLPDV
jgi:hypothetical protein